MHGIIQQLVIPIKNDMKTAERIVNILINTNIFLNGQLINTIWVKFGDNQFDLLQLLIF